MEQIREDVWQAVGDAICFAHKSDDAFYSNCMLFTLSWPVRLPEHFA